ncbi:MAG: 7-carboxy-7-deazaguanine synthase QueE [Candidatus Shapirobacteria bacterium]|jgi:organic radical activating enzyme
MKKQSSVVYKPTKGDLLKSARKLDFFKVSGDKVFATLQGEGLLESEGGTAGCPAVFLRLQFCNLHCGFPNGWRCDTGYTWDTKRAEYWQEPEDWSIEKTKIEIEKAWVDKFGLDKNIQKRVVITGGEPLLQQDLIVKLLNQMKDWQVEIETNGTIKPSPELIQCQINCSPKLANSGNEKKLRFRPEVLSLINGWPVGWFKFVVSRVEDLKEIEEIVESCNLNPKRVLIMPEGLTKEAVTEHQTLVQKDTNSRGWRIIERNQLIWFGPKRRT